MHGRRLRISTLAVSILGMQAGCGGTTPDTPEENLATTGYVPEAVDEDRSLFNQDELDAAANLEAQSQPDAITWGAPDSTLHREVVSLQRGGAHFCSGVTISERYILTAGHCIAGALGYPTRTSGSIGSLQVVYSPDGVTKTTVYSGGASAMISPNYILQKAYPCSFSEHDRAVIQLGGDASQFVRARWHNQPIQPSVIAHEAVGWGRHGEAAGSPTPSGVLRMVGWFNSHGWDANQGIKLVGGSATDSGDSGGGYFIKPGSSTRILVGNHACKVNDFWNHGANGPILATHAWWVLSAAQVLGRPLSCGGSSLGGVSYHYGCSD